MPQVVNWELLANPLNWVIVFLMLTIFGFALHIIMAKGS